MPILYEAALFLSQYLFEIPGNPYLQSGPSISPENSFTDGSGVYQASLSPVYEITVIRDIFTSYLQAVKLPAGISLKDKNYAVLAEKIEEQIERLPPFRIAEDGSLCEWSHDLPAVDSQHRHTSHLLGLYPYNQISPEKTPEFAAAAETSLVKRLTPADNWEDTGWSRSLLMLYSASLKKGDQAYEHIDSMLRHLLQPALLVKHPPTRGAPAFDDVYEMDGNTGLTTCIAHMLLQTSADETVELLPALPAQWRDGQVRGLCASGRISVTIKWQSGRLVEAIINSDLDQKRVFSYRGRRQTIKLEADKPIRVVYE
jgi:alpha-L-fucosidase 2